MSVLTEKLKRLAEAATPGQWLQYADTKVYIPIGDWGKDIAICEEVKDAEFIAAANPTAVLSLIAYIEQLEERVEQLKRRPNPAHGAPRPPGHNPVA